MVKDTVARSSKRFKEDFVGAELIALWETATPLDHERWEMRGLSDNYLRVRAIAGRNLWNQLSPVRISRVEENELFAEIFP